jgi:hypothetical protein
VRIAGVPAGEGAEERVKRPVLASVYRERISDERLKAVSDWVRKWLFAEEEQDHAGRGSLGRRSRTIRQ